jgi:O-succinylbenzoate synthase
MDIWFWRYRLQPHAMLGGVAKPGAREGALVRMENGVADIHPWPELGDVPLDEQLALLSRGEVTRLTRASIALARSDGEARARGISLFEGLSIPESHWPGADPPEGFHTVKLKSAERIPADVRVRIDFNARLSEREFLNVAERLPRERVDFIEDPCPYDERVWRTLRETTGLRLALDRGVANEGEFDVLVHKPALEVTWPPFAGEIVVTSYMDHPVGQLGAAYVAASREVTTTCGLFTHVLYENDAFIERMTAVGPRLLPPEGTGVGFDDLLEGLPWKRLT